MEKNNLPDWILGHMCEVIAIMELQPEQLEKTIEYALIVYARHYNKSLSVQNQESLQSV